MVETEYWLARLTNGDVIEVLITQQDRGDAAPWSFRWRYRGQPVEGTLYRDRRAARRSALKYLANEKLDLISWGLRPEPEPPVADDVVEDDEDIPAPLWLLVLATMAHMGNAMTAEDVVARCFALYPRRFGPGSPKANRALEKLDMLIRSGEVELIAHGANYRIVRLADQGRDLLSTKHSDIVAAPPPPDEVVESQAPCWQLVLTTMGTMGAAMTIEDVIVRCFKRHPRQFGLEGHPTLCDSNRVLPKLYTLIRIGEVEMVAQGADYRVVRLTDRGRLHLQCLAAGIDMPDVEMVDEQDAAE